MKNNLEEIVSLFLNTKETDLSIFDDAFLQKSVQNRIHATHSERVGDYLDYLSANKEESVQLMNSMHVAYSEFFRNPLTFSVLEQIILPSLLEKKKASNEKSIRVWSSACASGQEPYTVAILFDELIERTHTEVICRIFATDINSNELARASRGVYQLASLSKVPYRLINHYFVKRGDSFTISKELRKYIDFSCFDLLSQQGDSPPASIYGDFDLIFCSNVLFYYKPEVRTRILQKLVHNLSPGGYLITGEVEREILKRHKLKEVFPNSAIFQYSKEQ